MRIQRRWTLQLIAGVVLTGAMLHGEPVLSTSFETGKDTPEGWILERSCPGKWEQEGHTGSRSVSLTGTSKNHGRWTFRNTPLEPNHIYRFSVWYKTKIGNKKKAPNSVLVGINTSFKKFKPSPDWTLAELTFRAPADGKGMAVRLGQFRFDGKLWFDDLTIEAVKPAYLERDGIQLDENERIEKGRYIFDTNLESPFTNCYRVAEKQTVVHHENRMWFRENRYLIHKYHVGGHMQRSAELFLKVTQEGPRERRRPLKMIVEQSRDGNKWETLRTITSAGDYTIQLPKALFPARAVFVRITGSGNFQVRKLRYTAELDGSPPDLKGTTEAYKPNHAVLDNGALRLVVEEGRGPIVSIARGRQTVGRLECLIAQFEEKGMSYKNTGIGSAPAGRVKSFTVKKEEGKQTVDIVVERVESEETKRRFEATYRLTLPDKKPWFESRLLSVKNTDKVGVKLLGYYHRLQPRADAGLRSHAWPLLAAWTGKREFLGITSRTPEAFVFGFRHEYGDVTRPLDADLPAGETWKSEEPSVLIYLGEGGKKGFTAATNQARKGLGLQPVRFPPLIPTK